MSSTPASVRRTRTPGGRRIRGANTKTPASRIQRHQQCHRSFQPLVSNWTPRPGVNYIYLYSRDAGHSARDFETARELSEVPTDGTVVALVLALRCSEALTFQGVVEVLLLAGSAEINGFELSRGLAFAGTDRDLFGVDCGLWRRVYSPVSHPLLALKAGCTSTTESRRQVEANAQVLERILGRFSEGGFSAIIALRETECGIEGLGKVAVPFHGLFSPSRTTRRQRQQSKASARNKRQRKADDEGKDLTLSSSESDSSDSETVAEVPDNSRTKGDDAAGGTQDKVDIESEWRSMIALPNFFPVWQLPQDATPLCIPPEWEDAATEFVMAQPTMDESSRSVPPVAVLAGNRSCGKSVFLRYLVNRLLSECPYVYYLETDLGQSELMPSGVIGLYRIESPLLGPPFTHASSVIPVHAIYMGVTTPREDPDKYSLSIQHLAQMYHVEMAVQPGYGGQEAGAMPLVVNTQGWIRGLGLDLLGVTCQAVAPTHYYQFHVPVSLSADGSLYQQQAAPQLVPLVDFSAAGGVSPRIVWVPSVPTKIAGTLIPPSVMFSALADRAESGSDGSNGMALSGLPQFASVAYMFEQQTAGTSISNNSSMVEPDAMATSGGNYLNQIGSGRKGLRFSAHDMRTLAMMSHLYTVPSRQPVGGAFRLAWDFDTPVSSRPPLVVPWKDLILWIGDEDVPKNQALRAINGTIVGLVAALAEDQALIKNSHNGARQTSDTDIDSDGGAAPEVQRSMPRIQYGYPDIESFTFVAHAFVRCIDSAASSYHLLVPSVLYANPEVLNRVVGMIKGPGSGSSGIDVPIWALTDGGNGDLAMGGVQSLRQRRQNQQGSATNAPYLSVQATDGVGSATQTVRRNLARKMYS